MRVAYIDPVSGVSGDMLLGALIDAGAAIEDVRAALAPLRLAGWSLDVEQTQRGGLRALCAVVTVTGATEPHSARTVRDVLALLDAPGLHPHDRAQARAVFALLGDVEAHVHGVPADGTQHLHEVGAVDALIDVVGTIAALRLLGVEALYAGPLPLGDGTARSAHGVLPVPAPAVLEIAARARIPLAAPRAGEPAFELVTPTGTAILGALARFERPPLTLERIGVGAGGRDLDGWPNITRVWLGQTIAHDGPDTSDALHVRPLAVVQTDIDDTSPEQLPFMEARLREAGALDVWWSSVQMKKGRPGIEVTAIADPALEQTIVAAMLRHSSTLGVRVSAVLRYEAAREVLEFVSSLGMVVVKVKRLPAAAPTIAPEYEACRILAERHALPLAEVYRIVTAEAWERLDTA